VSKKRRKLQCELVDLYLYTVVISMSSDSSHIMGVNWSFRVTHSRHVCYC